MPNPPYGVTPLGFVRPSLSDIQTLIVNPALIATFGADSDLSASGPFGQLSGIMCSELDLLWQGLEDTYNSQYPDTAFGASLDNVGAISGIPRLGALMSTLQSVKLYGTAGTVVTGGTTLFSVQNSPTSLFALGGTTTLAAGANCIQHITFSGVPTAGQWAISLNGHTTGFLAFNANAAAVQAAVQALQFASGCTVTGDYAAGFTITFTGAGTGGLMVQPAFTIPTNTLVNGITPVTVPVTITQAGVDQANVTAIATAVGPTIANAGTLTVIATPVAGLTAVLNTLDAVVGRNTELDNPYRARRSQELQIAGKGTVESIRAALLQLTGVTSAIVFENVTDIVDANGRPPHSFEAVVQGGADQDIRNLLWAVKPAGVKSFGGVHGTITDSQGQVHEIDFSRPTPLLVYVALTITKNANFPANGAAVAAQNVVNAGNALGEGAEVVVFPYLMSALAGIVGIEGVQFFIGLAPNPLTSANIAVAANQIAVFDTSRVNVVTV